MLLSMLLHSRTTYWTTVFPKKEYTRVRYAVFSQSGLAAVGHWDQRLVSSLVDDLPLAALEISESYRVLVESGVKWLATAGSNATIRIQSRGDS